MFVMTDMDVAPGDYPVPTPATIKELYGTAFRCAHPDCSKPPYRCANDSGERIPNSRVAHIHGRRRNGPRCKLMDPEENRRHKNLLVLCIEHSYEVDDKELEIRYPAELLLGWKAKQLKEYDDIQRSWPLSDSEAAEVVSASFGATIAVQAEAVVWVARSVT